MSLVIPEAHYVCMSSFREGDASASGSYGKVKGIKGLQDILRAILLSKCTCFEVFQTNYMFQVNQTCPPIYGPICNPLLLQQGLELHFNNKIPNICIWQKIPATPVVRSRGLTESNLFFLVNLSF